MDKFDLNRDGNVTPEELEIADKIIAVSNRDEKMESQRKMAWLAIVALIAYACIPLVPFIDETRLSTISAMADTLFIALASIVGFFFGSTAYMNRK